jgi:hypothetical protein
MTCPDCERYKESAKNWRHKVYELSGHPLPWERGDTWVGLTDETIWLEYQHLWPFHPAEEPTLAKDIVRFAKAIEAKLKEKNT